MATNTSVCNGVIYAGQPLSCPIGSPPPGGTACDTCSGGYGACAPSCGAGTQTCTMDIYTAHATDDPCTVLHGGAYYVGGACNSEKTMLYQCAGTPGHGLGYSTSHQNCNCQVNSGGEDTCNGQIACTQGPSAPIACSGPPCDQVPKGFHDGSTCSVVNGWTCDPDNYSLPLAVHFYEGPGFTNFVGATTANVTREAAVGAECGGNSAHGFNFTPPSSLIDGNTHSIWAYPINIDSSGNPTGYNPSLLGTPKTLGPCGYSAGGLVYIDKNKNGIFDAAIDSPYSGSASITICQGNQPGGCTSPYETLTTSTANGTFANAGVLSEGAYTAILTVPSGYQATSPKPPIAVFTVGNNCAPAGNCNAGNVSNLNFGITNSFPWIQAIGGYVTGNFISNPTGGGFTDAIPSSTSVAAGACSVNGAYALAPGAGGTHGLIHLGARGASFGQGQEAAAQSWLVGGLGGGNYPYVYNMPLSHQARTAYTNLS